MCSKDNLIDFEKSFEFKINNISKSLFQEVIFVLSEFDIYAKKYIHVDTLDNVNAIVISNISYYNNINKIGLYNLILEKKNIIIKQSDIRTDVSSLNKRLKFISSILMNEINKHKILKIEKINKNMSDSEISDLKKLNKIKESILLKLHNKIKGMKISTCI